MEPIDSKPDLFQSLKNGESNEQEGTSQRSVSESEDLKFESQNSDDENNGNDPGTSSYDKELKKKIEKQNRKEIEEEEREKML